MSKVGHACRRPVEVNSVLCLSLGWKEVVDVGVAMQQERRSLLPVDSKINPGECYLCYFAQS